MSKLKAIMKTFKQKSVKAKEQQFTPAALVSQKKRKTGSDASAEYVKGDFTNLLLSSPRQAAQGRMPQRITPNVNTGIAQRVIQRLSIQDYFRLSSAQWAGRVPTLLEMLDLDRFNNLNEIQNLANLAQVTNWAHLAQLAALTRSTQDIITLAGGRPAPSLQQIIDTDRFTLTQLQQMAPLVQVNGWNALVQLAALNRSAQDIITLAGFQPAPSLQQIIALDRFTVAQIRQIANLAQVNSWANIVQLAALNRPAPDIITLAGLQVGGQAPTLVQIIQLDGINNAEINNIIQQTTPTNWGQVCIAKQMGTNVSAAMGIANINNGPLQYPGVAMTNPQTGLQEVNAQGYLNPVYWVPIAFSSFRLRQGAQPAAAVRDAFAGPTRLECLSTTRAVLAKSLLEILGDTEFNNHFSWTSNNDPGVVIGTNNQLVDRVQQLMVSPNANSVNDLIKGDWIYFQNDVRYPDKHPTGLWQGENCIYEGNNLLSGFGLANMSINDLTQNMEHNFNLVPTQRDIQSNPRLDSTNPNYDANLATAQNPNVVGLRYDTLRRFNFPQIQNLLP
ncbi:MAG: hypothetical protein GY950_34790 [bacterium]|nr:hypothetical protein [bacterium]